VAYNVAGGIGWVVSMTTLGYLLGQIPWVQKNIEKATVLIILLSVSPLFWHYLQARLRARTIDRAASKTAASTSINGAPMPADDST
jgi:membrane protein DedA with SNARE-associated domain